MHETFDTFVSKPSYITVNVSFLFEYSIMRERLERMLAHHLLLLVATRRSALMITLLLLPCCDDQLIRLEQPNGVDDYVTYSLARVSEFSIAYR